MIRPQEACNTCVTNRRPSPKFSDNTSFLVLCHSLYSFPASPVQNLEIQSQPWSAPSARKGFLWDWGCGCLRHLRGWERGLRLLGQGELGAISLPWTWLLREVTPWHWGILPFSCPIHHQELGMEVFPGSGGPPSQYFQFRSQRLHYISGSSGQGHPLLGSRPLTPQFLPHQPVASSFPPNISVCPFKVSVSSVPRTSRSDLKIQHLPWLGV